MASELQKRAIYFLILTFTITVILLAIPFLETWINDNLLPQFGLTLHEGKPAIVEVGENGVAALKPAGVTAVTMYNLSITLIQILKVILGMVLVIASVRFILYLITKMFYRGTVQGEISSLLKTVLSIIIYVVAFFIIFQSQFPGVELTAVFTGSTIVGIVVGLALQDTLGNLFAGLALSADQPFQVGDVIMIPGRGEGVIEKVTWRGVTIRTFQNKLLVISNSVLGKEIFEVAPKKNLNAKLVFFNTLYTNSPAKTIHAVREAVRQVENVSPKMRPIVRIRALAADGIDWEVKYWLEDYRLQQETDALVRQRIWYVFQREKINFAYPTRTVYVERKKAEPPPEEIFNETAEMLNRVSIFAPLSDEEIERLANVSTTRIYAPGEAIVHRGQEGNSMYLIIRGAVKVQILENGVETTVGVLRENDFFGEMSLLTGEPRTATVIATEETEVLRIDKEGLKPIFEDNPNLVSTISELVEERRELLRSQAEEAIKEIKDAQPKGRVLATIKRFFGLE